MSQRVCALLVAIGSIALAPVLSARHAPDPGAPTRNRRAQDSLRTTSLKAKSPIVIRRARLEPTPRRDESESVLLKFDVHNQSETSQANILLSVSLLGPAGEDSLEPRPVIVRPFSIRVETVLRAGYLVEYEILLRNLSSDCDCLPRIDVVSARPVQDVTNY